MVHLLKYLVKVLFDSSIFSTFHPFRTQLMVLPKTSNDFLGLGDKEVIGDGREHNRLHLFEWGTNLLFLPLLWIKTFIYSIVILAVLLWSFWKMPLLMVWKPLIVRRVNFLNIVAFLFFLCNKHITSLFTSNHSNVCNPVLFLQVAIAILFLLYMTLLGWLGSNLMKHKDEVFSIFQIFHKWVQNYLHQNIKILCSDNGKEYLSRALLLYLQENGTTCPHTQQNSVVEQKYHPLLDVARSLLTKMEVPKSFSLKQSYMHVIWLIIYPHLPHRINLLLIFFPTMLCPYSSSSCVCLCLFWSTKA